MLRKAIRGILEFIKFLFQLIAITMVRVILVAVPPLSFLRDWLTHNDAYWIWCAVDTSLYGLLLFLLLRMRSRKKKKPKSKNKA